MSYFIFCIDRKDQQTNESFLNYVQNFHKEVPSINLLSYDNGNSIEYLINTMSPEDTEMIALMHSHIQFRFVTLSS
jgi:hypothetical protein